jgi:hypothetical protein
MRAMTTIAANANTTTSTAVFAATDHSFLHTATPRF